MTTRALLKLTATLGFVSLGAGVISVLALADISRGEADLRLEWRTIQLAAVLILAFHLVAFWALRRVLRTGTV